MCRKNLKAETTQSGHLADHHGFSLVELIVAMSIFMIVSLGALPLMISNMHLNQRNQMRNEGFAVASRWVDWLHAQDWRPTGTSALDVPDVDQTTDTLDTRFQYAIDCTPVTITPPISPIPPIRRVDCDVRVDWSYKGQAYNYGTSTIIID